ncbi:MAG: hypothetical protein ISS48_04600 [Candidatus Aenigmarchaeota archaeon]|nr:hypothetical protein [Candidatus Aenigmarchaeota archaeon]
MPDEEKLRERLNRTAARYRRPFGLLVIEPFIDHIVPIYSFTVRVGDDEGAFTGGGYALEDYGYSYPEGLEDMEAVIRDVLEGAPKTPS